MTKAILVMWVCAAAGAGLGLMVAALQDGTNANNPILGSALGGGGTLAGLIVGGVAALWLTRPKKGRG
jgi:hypothetical protein